MTDTRRPPRVAPAGRSARPDARRPLAVLVVVVAVLLGLVALRAGAVAALVVAAVAVAILAVAVGVFVVAERRSARSSTPSPTAVKHCDCCDRACLTAAICAPGAEPLVRHGRP